eukprot:9467775-Pyramimonas_sp.AAC.1
MTVHPLRCSRKNPVGAHERRNQDSHTAANMARHWALVETGEDGHVIRDGRNERDELVVILVDLLERNDSACWADAAQVRLLDSGHVNAGLQQGSSIPRSQPQGGNLGRESTGSKQGGGAKETTATDPRDG